MTSIQKPKHKYNLRTQILYTYKKAEMTPRYSQGTTVSNINININTVLGFYVSNFSCK
jgi:hypothetical protein